MCFDCFFIFGGFPFFLVVFLRRFGSGGRNSHPNLGASVRLLGKVWVVTSWQTLTRKCVVFVVHAVLYSSVHIAGFLRLRACLFFVSKHV